MKQSKYITGLALAAVLSLSMAAQDQKRSGSRGNAPQTDRVEQQNTQPQNVQPPSAQAQNQNAAPNPRVPRNGFVANRPDVEQQRRGGGNRHLHPFGPRAGDWLRQFKDVPPEQQDRALNNDPAFQRLPAHRQEKLRERLKQFNSLSPEKRNQLLDRMETWESMSQEQRQRLRSLQDRMKQLPDDRREKVRKAFGFLRGLAPERRHEFLASPRFTSQFSAEEQDLLHGLIDIATSPELHEPEDPRLND